MVKKSVMLVLFFITLVLLISSTNFVSAYETKLLCIDKGNTVAFSECNPLIEDRTCNSDIGCKYCVGESSDGVYCPKSINECNSAHLSCTFDSGITENNNPTSDTNSNNSNTNNNPATNENNTPNTSNNTPNNSDSSQNPSTTEFGASIGSRITVGNINKTNKNTITGNIIGSNGNGNSFVSVLVISMILEFIIILYLLKVNKKIKARSF